ncbi:MAG: hypothetical protein JST73_10585 [Actinobacteria bacterium]|nr:hypothetical protein [Actinomycetota bacterium]
MNDPRHDDATDATDDATPTDTTGATDDATATGVVAPDPTVRRHLVVLAIAVIGIVVGSVLVVTGRTRPVPTTATTTATTLASPRLPDLGSVADRDAAKRLVETLDPVTLRVRAGAPTTSSPAPSPTVSVPTGDEMYRTIAGLERCQGAIVQQNTDRSLGERHAQASLVVGGTPTIVASYALPASASSPSATRVLIVDARTCRILAAIQS